MMTTPTKKEHTMSDANDLLNLVEFVRTASTDDADELDCFVTAEIMERQGRPPCASRAWWERELQAWRTICLLGEYIANHPEAVEPSPEPGRVAIRLSDEVADALMRTNVHGDDDEGSVS
jgi:hypothetical protein